MDDWSHGYEVSEGYTYGFGRETAPDWLDLCAATGGRASPRKGKGFRYLELGSGQGMGLNLLAAANPDGEFVGVDFLPEHVAHANAIAGAAGLGNVRFSDADFLDLAAAWPAGFGTFDYVVLHGIYTWVSPEVRDAVVRCIGHATHEGSLVYLGYNTQPGWLGSAPFQHITSLIRRTSGKTGREAIESSIQLFDRMRAGNAVTFQILPALKAQVQAVKTANIAYLVQEYCNQNWQPMWHSEVADELAEVGLTYAASATIAENLLPAMLPPALRDTIIGQPEGSIRQDLQDFVINQSFRRDIFCRTDQPRSQKIGVRAKFHLLSPPTENVVPIKTAFGEITLQVPAIAGVLDALRAGPKTFDELSAVSPAPPSDTLNLLLLLTHAQIIGVGPAAPGDPAAAHRLNRVIAEGAAKGAPYDHIAAPALGSAIPATGEALALFGSADEDGQLRQWRVLGAIA